MVINNLTKNWQEIIWWPDTTLTMQNGTGIEDYAEDGGFALSQNNPNPFSGTTDVSLTVAEEGKVQLEIADMNGRAVVESQNYTSLQLGNHQFRISLSTIGAYVMTARQNGKTSSIKMICNGGSGTNTIDYLGETQSITYTLKSTTNKPFNYGDMMEYIGYATFNGSEVESQRITQAQGTSQTFTLQFAAMQLPNAPTGVTATVSGTQILVSWNPVSNATNYKVYRCSYANGSYTQIGSTTSNNYYDANPLIYNYYKVKAVNSAGESDYSLYASCNYVTVPEVTTNTTVNNVTSSTASCGGNVSSSGGATVTSRGVCWSISPNPTISGAHTSNGSGTGSFTSNMSGLAANTVYYVRAYATNSAGTNYGEQRTFTTTTFTCGSNTTDYNGNSYNTVQIGSQCWMKENLKTSNLNNATPISLIQDSTTWASTSSAAYCYYSISSYGCLYNYYAVSSGLLCPPGWHVPSYNEVFGTLYSSLGGTDVGGKMKITGTTYWQSPNTGATNSSEFSARGGGCRPEGMSFYRINTHAVFWTTTNYEDNADYVKTYCMSYNSAALMNYGYSNYGYSMSKKSGLSVRCLREESAPSSPCDAADQCTYTFNLTDSYGDGWNGGVLSVQQNGVTVASITLSEGSSGTETVNLCNNISTSLLWTPGSYVSEVGFSIQDPSGNEVYSITGMSNYSTYTFIPSCSEIIVPASGSTTITTCNSWIYDNGGSTGDYQNNSDGYIVVTPATTGQGISLEGTYDVESNYDHIYVYAGVGTSGTQLGSYSGSGTISLTNNGTVTIRFTSDNSVVNPGFAIHATCASATAPSAPTGVTATVSGSQIYISWNSVSNATSYKVYRSSSSSGSYTLIGSPTSSHYYDASPLSGYNYYKVKAVNSVGESSYSSVAPCDYSGGGTTVPTVTTSNVSDISTTTATCGGNVTSNGGSTVTARGVCWSTSQNPTVSNSHTTNGSGTGSFTSSITGLSSSTTYYVRAYATNSAGTAYGTQRSFTTEAGSGTKPTVTTNTVSNVSTTTATCGGNVTNSGSSSVTVRGVCWSTSQNPTVSNSHTTNGSGTGSFTSSITGLSSSTTYYVRAYATNSAGTAYGTQRTFTTEAGSGTPPTVTTNTVSNVSTTTATCGGNVTSSGSASVTARGVCWSTSQNPTVSGSHTTNGSGTGSFTSSITGLTANTTYYVRAYATNSAGTAYGAQKTFTTTAGAQPTVTTNSVSGVTSTTATCGGNVTSAGGTSVTARGVCWSTSQNPTVSGSHTTNGSGTGSFTSSITGLTANTTYYVRAYATNSAGTAYGAQKTFTTTAGAQPTVTTNSVSGVTSTTATCGGNVTSAGGTSVTARGVCWSTSQNPTVSGSHTTNGSGTGSFTSSISGLNPSTTYYVRAYATNSAGTAYGTQKTFTTAAGAPCSPTVSVSGTSYTTQVVSWTNNTGSGCGTPTSFKVYQLDPCDPYIDHWVLRTTTSSHQYWCSSSNVHPGINKYKVVAINNNGTSEPGYANSPAVSFPAPGGIFSASNLGGGNIQFTWQAVDKATGYQIMIATSQYGNYSVDETIYDEDITTITKHYSFSSGTTRYFKIRAVFDCVNYSGGPVYSNYSNVQAVQF